MKKYNIPGTDLCVSSIALGCMRYANKPVDEIEELVLTAVEKGINFVDHADIYRNKQNIYSETVFGEVLKRNPGLREKLIIQSKCGICNGFYDFSKKHIIDCVDQSLERMGIEYLDILLLHRPDALMDPKEVAEAFDELAETGKVHYFGVSNMNPGQIRLLQKYCDQKLIFNQLEFSLVASGMIDYQLNVNMTNDLSIDRDGDVLNYCRTNNITIQAWSPLQISLREGTFIDSDRYPELNICLDQLSKEYGVSKYAIAIAWILRHPSGIIPIAGTTNKNNLLDLIKADEISLTREQWYKLYLSVGKTLA